MADLEMKISKKKGKTKYFVKGDGADLLDTLLDVNLTLFNKFIFNQKFQIPEKEKFEIIDSFVNVFKSEMEQAIVFNK